MRTEGFEQSGEIPAGVLAGELLEPEQRRLEFEALVRQAAIEAEEDMPGSAARGLVMAAPLSLAFWMALGALLWAFTR